MTRGQRRGDEQVDYIENRYIGKVAWAVGSVGRGGEQDVTALEWRRGLAWGLGTGEGEKKGLLDNYGAQGECETARPEERSLDSLHLALRDADGTPSKE